MTVRPSLVMFMKIYPRICVEFLCVSRNVFVLEANLYFTTKLSFWLQFVGLKMEKKKKFFGYLIFEQVVNVTS